MDLFETLNHQNTYTELCQCFIKNLIKDLEEEKEQNIRYLNSEDIYFTLDLLVQRHISTVFKLSQSPIEIALANSLMLCFLKNGMPLITTMPFENACKGLKEMRSTLKQLKKFVAYYESKYNSSYISKEYLDSEVAKKKLPSEERPILEDNIFYYHHNNFENAYHLTLQSRIYLNSRHIYPDILIWKPSSPKLKLIVECDGFEYHSSKRSFTQDRQRDRELQMKNYKVLRIAGTEIYNSPINAASSLFDYLD